MSLCPHGYRAFYDCPICPEPMGTAVAVQSDDVQFRCEPALYDPYPATVTCGWCGGEKRTTTEDPCPECLGTGEVETPDL